MRPTFSVILQVQYGIFYAFGEDVIMSTHNSSGSAASVAAGHKEMGIFRMVTAVITLIVGGGVWSFTGDMAASGANTGAVLTAWALSGVGVFCLMMCFYGLSRVKPELEGGIYSYASAGFGDFAGFNSAWGYWISAILCTVSFSALLFSALAYFFPVFGAGNNLPSVIGASVIVWGYTLLVSRGIKDATAVNAVVTISKMVPLFVAVVALIFLQKFDPEVFFSNFWGEPGGLPFGEQVMGAVSTTAWVFLGIEGACALSGRAKHPSDVGRATVISFCCVIAIYLVVSILGMGVMPREQLAELSNPSLAGIMEYAVGPWGATLINGGVVLSLLGGMLGYTVLSSESPYEAACQGVFTKSFAKTNDKGAPVVTLVASALIVEAFLVLMLFNEATYQFFYVISLGMILVPYVLSSAYFAKVSFKEPEIFGGKLRMPMPFWKIMGIVGVVYAIFLVYATGLSMVVLMSLLFVPGIFVYVKGKKERGLPFLDNTRDRAILVAIVGLAAVSIVLLATGIVDVFA